MLERRPPSPVLAERLLDLLDAPRKGFRTWSVDSAREFSNSLRAVVPLFADAACARTLLGTKQTQKWLGDAFDADVVKELNKTLARDDGRGDDRLGLAVDHLVVARLAHAAERRKRHARLAIRARLLWGIFALLLPLVVGTALVFTVALDADAWDVVAAAVAGALGSVLSGALKLRELYRLRDLRAFKAGVAVQPVLGAAAGLFMFLLVRVGVLHLPPADESPTTESYALYGFLGGFSEPFVLGLVQRLTAGRDAAS